MLLAIIRATTAPFYTLVIPVQLTLTALINSLTYVPAMLATMITAILPVSSAVRIVSLASLSLNASPAMPLIIALSPHSAVPAPADITKTASTPPARLAITLVPSAMAVQIPTVTTALISAPLPCHTVVHA